MNIPSEIRQGATVKWRDDATQDSLDNEITSATYTLTFSFRTNVDSQGLSIQSTSYGTGWQTVIPSGTTALMEPGEWYWQAAASDGSETHFLGAGRLTVQKSLDFSGTAEAFDGRSQAEKDLDDVEAAIRAVAKGGASKEYRIGQRQLKRYDMAELLMLKQQLKAEVVREKKAEMIDNGLGNPHKMFIRFNN